MVFEKKEISRFLTITVILLVGLLVFFLLKPLIISIFSGLILAYLLVPVYRKALKIFRSKNLTAAIVLILLIIVIIVPLWFVVPIAINQFFGIFKYSQTLDVTSFVKALFPTASEAFLTQSTVTFNTLVSKATSAILGSLTGFFMEIPTIFLHLFVVGFVFFFGLRDSDKLIQLAKELSPLNKSKEKIIIQQFKEITDSIVYSHIVVGIIQGLLAGIGFLIFGVHNALVLTMLVILTSIIPPLGPYLVYVPVAVVIFSEGNMGVGIAYLLYNIAIVSTLDNFLRTYIVARMTKISTVVVFVGMIGGLFMFGVIGILLGPLILAYFLIILQLYKEKELSTLFFEEEPAPPINSDKK